MPVFIHSESNNTLSKSNKIQQYSQTKFPKFQNSIFYLSTFSYSGQLYKSTGACNLIQ